MSSGSSGHVLKNLFTCNSLEARKALLEDSTSKLYNAEGVNDGVEVKERAYVKSRNSQANNVANDFLISLTTIDDVEKLESAVIEFITVHTVADAGSLLTEADQFLQTVANFTFANSNRDYIFVVGVFFLAIYVNAKGKAISDETISSFVATVAKNFISIYAESKNGMERVSRMAMYIFISTYNINFKFIDKIIVYLENNNAAMIAEQISQYNRRLNGGLNNLLSSVSNNLSSLGNNLSESLDNNQYFNSLTSIIGVIIFTAISADDKKAQNQDQVQVQVQDQAFFLVPVNVEVQVLNEEKAQVLNEEKAQVQTQALDPDLDVDLNNKKVQALDPDLDVDLNNKKVQALVQALDLNEEKANDLSNYFALVPVPAELLKELNLIPSQDQAQGKVFAVVQTQTSAMSSTKPGIVILPIQVVALSKILGLNSYQVQVQDLTQDQINGLTKILGLTEEQVQALGSNLGLIQVETLTQEKAKDLGETLTLIEEAPNTNETTEEAPNTDTTNNIKKLVQNIGNILSNYQSNFEETGKEFQKTVNNGVAEVNNAKDNGVEEVNKAANKAFDAVNDAATNAVVAVEKAINQNTESTNNNMAENQGTTEGGHYTTETELNDYDNDGNIDDKIETTTYYATAEKKKKISAKKKYDLNNDGNPDIIDHYTYDKDGNETLDKTDFFGNDGDDAVDDAFNNYKNIRIEDYSLTNMIAIEVERVKNYFKNDEIDKSLDKSLADMNSNQLYAELVKNWSFSIDTDSTTLYKLRENLEPNETWLSFSTIPEFTPNADETNSYNITFHLTPSNMPDVEEQNNNNNEDSFNKDSFNQEKISIEDLYNKQKPN